MIDNFYYILPYPNINSSIWDLIVETPSELRTNNNGNKCIVKLYSGDTTNHSIFNGITKYTHEEIKDILKAPEWVKDL